MPSQINTVCRVGGRGSTGLSTSATTPCDVTVSQHRWTTSAGATATTSAERVSNAACSRGPGDARRACCKSSEEEEEVWGSRYAVLCHRKQQ